MRTERMVKLAPALALLALVVPSSAFGQATRTWVSGVGDDVNPCSRTAPCKTLVGAHNKTAAGGEINAIDGGGFGALTITKSITIDLSGSWEGGVLSSPSTGIIVNAQPTDRVTLRGMDIYGGTSNTGHGIRILQARSVKIVDNKIFNYGRNGISVENSNALVRVIARRNDIHDNGGNGVLVAPTLANGARVTLRANDIDDNTCGIALSTIGTPATPDYNTNCGTAGTATSTSAINAFRNSISDSEKQGVFANGSTSTIRIGHNEITGSNTAPAVQAIGAASILSYGNNFVVGNPGGPGAFTGTVAPL